MILDDNCIRMLNSVVFALNGLVDAAEAQDFANNFNENYLLNYNLKIVYDDENSIFLIKEFIKWQKF